MAAVVSEKMAEPSLSPPPSLSVDRTPSRRVSDAAASDSSSFANSPDRAPVLDRSSSSSRQLDFQNQLLLKSEEYRQLFRLPQDEVLIQDFNCALQENFLLQGHMYLFAHYICFYSNLFGFETKKIIPFHEITSLRRAKSAAIFPTAIEIIAGGKKFFFTSFLSRDEAFKIINDGWLENSTGVKSITDQQDSNTGLNSQENGSATIENVESSGQLVDELNLIERDTDVSTAEDLTANGEPEIVSLSSGVQGNAEKDLQIVQSSDCSSSGKPLVWEPENFDPPEVPECFTMVAQSKFPVKVEEFFQFFFSDDTVDFQDSFHRKCGDKDFKCSDWRTHGKFGHTRDVSFQHPIKLYLGAKFGSCQEVQKYRVYKNCHLVVETSQEISDVPYGDYFRVEGLWHLERDGDEYQRGCNLRVYVNVNFSKKTMFKGKIVQSTVDECRDAYATWIDLAHELLKQKNLEIEGNLIHNNQVQGQMEEETLGHVKMLNEATEEGVPRTLPSSKDVNQQAIDSSGGSHSGSTSVTYSVISDPLVKFFSALKSQSPVSLLLVISIAVIFLLMQISILTLLSRPQQIHVVPQADWMYSVNRGATERGGEIALLDKQIKHLKEEIQMVGTLLEKMQQEHALLKLKLSDLEPLRERQK